MNVFRFFLAFFFLSYLQPTEVPQVVIESPAFKAAALSSIQSLPVAESLSVRTTPTLEKKFQPFTLSMAASEVQKHLGPIWLSSGISHFDRVFEFTAYRTRAPPV